MKRMTVLVFSLLMTMIAQPWAASADTPAAGDRVRVRPNEGKPVVGKVVSWDEDTLVVQTLHKKVESFPVESVAGVDRPVGKQSHTGTGALIGLTAGATLGLAAAVAEDGDAFLNDSGVKLAFVTLMAGIGALVGATFGTVMETDVWAPIDSGSLTFGVEPRSSRPVSVAWQVDF